MDNHDWERLNQSYHVSNVMKAVLKQNLFGL
jgi:hypothetical protein